MYISEINISNFRGFKKLNLCLNQGMNVLVGENNAGKTSIIDAIKCTLGTNSQEQCFIQQSDFNNDAEEINIQLKFKNIEKFGYKFVEYLTSDDGEICLYVNLIAKYTTELRRGFPVIKTEIKSGKTANGLVLENEVKRFLNATYLKPLRDAEQELKSSRLSRLSQIIGAYKEFDDIRNVDSLLEIIGESNKKILENQSLSIITNEVNKNFLNELIFAHETLATKLGIAGLESGDLNGMQENKKRKYFKEILEKLNLSIGEFSNGLGYNNLVFIAVELLLLEQDLENEFGCLLIEEPEAHIHPQLQMKLLEFIKTKSPDKKLDTSDKDNYLQCILSTHSPNLASKINPENMIIINKNQAFALRNEETKLDQDDYKFLYKFLDVTKSNLFFARGVVIVEGDAENILLPTIANLVGRKFEDYGVSIVNVGNTAWKRFAKIFLRNDNTSLPINVAVLRDLDLWPDCADESICPVIGFKKRKKRNSTYWYSNCSDVSEKRRKMKDDLEHGSIKVLISDDWTFEYCLSQSGLMREVLEALDLDIKEIKQLIQCIGLTQESKILFNLETNWNDILIEYNIIETGLEANYDVVSKERISTFIMKHIDKTDFALSIANILENKYNRKSKELWDKLPIYLKEAIEHVTEKVNFQNSEGDLND